MRVTVHAKTLAVHYDRHDADGRAYDDSPVGWATMGTGLVGAYVFACRHLRPA